jgi:protein CpxP
MAILLRDIVMKKFAMLGLVLLTAGSAFAQTPAPATTAPGPAAAPPAAAPSTASPPAAGKAVGAKAPASKAAAMDARIEQRIAQMHQRLKITPAQQPAWDAFAQVMRDNVTSMQQAYQERRASIATMSAPDNMRNFAQIEQTRTDGIQKLATSFQTLYDGMSDEQKKVADTMFRHYDDRGAKGRKAPK